MGLISPGGENLLDILELWQVLSTYDGDLRDPLWWPQQGPVPMLLARGHLEVRGINGAPLDVGGTLVLPLEWRRYVGELLEFQQGC